MNAFDISAVLTLNSAQFDTALKRAGAEAKGFGATAKTSFGAVGKAFGAMGIAAAAFAGLSLKTGSEFDKSMSQVAATMGKTMDEMKDEVGEVETSFGHFSGTLRDFAKFMGKNTAFSAKESADALNYMALAGYDTQTSMKMLPNVLNLASAGNMDLANASDMVTDSQSALGLSIKQTNELVDQMAKTSSKTNTSVEQLGSAILTVGGTAKFMNGGFATLADGSKKAYSSTTELTMMLGRLADNGIKGAEGGTALRNILNSISGKKFEKNFGAMGVEAYDASGKMRSMTDILKDMNKAMDGMTDEQKKKLIQNTFNVRDMKSVSALLDTDTKKWNELALAIEGSEGAAGKMAETQLDNLQGDITKLKSAFEGLQISISDKLSPAFRKLVQGVTSGIGVMTKAFEGMQFGDNISLDIGTIILKLQEKASEFSTIAANWLTSISEGFVKGIPQMLTYVLPALAKFTESLSGNAGKIIDAGTTFILNFAKGLVNSLPILIKYVPIIVTNIANVINENAPKILMAAGQLMVVLGKGLIDAIPVLVANIPNIIKAVVAAFLAFQWAGLGKSIIKGIGSGIKAAGGALKGFMKTAAKNAWNAFKGGFNMARSGGASLMKALGKAMASGAKSVVSSLKSALSKVKDTMLKPFKEGADKVKGIIYKIKSWFPFKLGNLFSGFRVPSISLSTASKTLLGKTFTYPTGFHVAWHRKAMDNPYLFKGATMFASGEPATDEMLYSKHRLLEDIAEVAGGGTDVQVTNYVTVDGAENPEEYASRLVRQIKMDMRTV